MRGQTRPNQTGAPVRPEYQHTELQGFHRRLLEVERRLGALEAEARLAIHHAVITSDNLAGMTLNGTSLFGLLTLPAGASVLAAYGWVAEPVIAAGTPRSGMVALTSLNVSVGTAADIDAYLVALNVYNLRPAWDAAADKGVALDADARVSSVQSFTADTEIIAACVPNANGDLTLITSGKIHVVVITYAPDF